MIEYKHEQEPEELPEEQFRISRDLKKAAATLSDREARYLVDKYYKAQDDRIRNAHQARGAEEAGEPHLVIDWFKDRSHELELSMKAALTIYCKAHKLGRWAMSIYGIGPVCAAGLMANIDIERAPTAGRIWRFAGLDPTSIWLGKDKASRLVDMVFDGQLRVDGTSPPYSSIGVVSVEQAIPILAANGPFKEETLRRFAADKNTGKITKASLKTALARQPHNASLKRLCWIIGGLFVRLRWADKTHNKYNDKDVYGKVYDERKRYETAKNEAGDYAPLAAATLTEKRFKDKATREIYEAGKLPDGRIDQRCRRYAVKIFLAHFHHVAYELHYKQKPPRPYIIEHGGHTNFIGPPNWPFNE